MRYHDHQLFGFASDNYSGVHSSVFEALIDANGGHDKAYGQDAYTVRLQALVAGEFGATARAYPVFNGTGANILGLAALLPRFGAVLCTEYAHIVCDESNAPEYIAGIKTVCVPSANGKLDLNLIEEKLGVGEHHAQIRAVYISQTTEYGTCYSLSELAQIRAVCDKHGLCLYIDGARLSNAAAVLGCGFADIARYADVLSLGGTKNGLMLGECLVVMNPDIGDLHLLRKMHLQTGSKMRFISAQFVAWLETGLWRELASHSNQMAQYLYGQIKDLSGVVVTQKVESNAVFAKIPQASIAQLQENFAFYVWRLPNEVRLMTSFDTTTEQVDAFVHQLKQYL